MGLKFICKISKLLNCLREFSKCWVKLIRINGAYYNQYILFWHFNSTFNDFTSIYCALSPLLRLIADFHTPTSEQ